MKRPKVLLADDHRIVLAGLERILASEFELVAAVENGRQLLSAAQKFRPDVVIVDISMPLLNGLEAVRRLKAADPKTKVIFLTMHASIDLAKEALRVGAAGYLLKHTAPEELIRAIREVLNGRAFVAPVLAANLQDASFTSPHRLGAISRKLTSREREVLQLVAEGHSAKEIASLLNLSRRTVEFHKYNLMNKLSLRTTAALVQYAIKTGLVAV